MNEFMRKVHKLRGNKKDKREVKILFNTEDECTSQESAVPLQ